MPSRIARFISVVIAALSIVVTVSACARTPPPDADFAAMDSGEVLTRQTVLVNDGRIVGVGAAADTIIPRGAVTVNSGGQFLMPGVAEMHGHYPNPSQQEFTDAVLFMYVANGVTLVRGMQGGETHLPLRDSIEAREILGPRLFVCAPSMTGNSVTTVEEAERLVREAAASGFDHLKVHEGLTPEVYATIAETATEVGITWSGHISNLVGLYDALEHGQQTIDHLDNVIEAMIGDRDAVANLGLFDLPALASEIDESKIDEVVAAIRAAGAGVVPTEVLWETFLGGRSGAQLVPTRPELAYWLVEGRPGIGQGANQWIAQADQRRETLASPEAGQVVIELRRRLIKALYDAGVPVLLGTDSPQVFSVPGFSIHHEMAVMVESGLTPFQVLHSGTKAVADFYGADDFGLVAVGHRADLVLLNANPLDDIANFADNDGVMVNGRWIPRDEIALRLADIRAMMAGIGQ